MNELLLHKANDHEGDLTKISPDFLRRKTLQHYIIYTQDVRCYIIYIYILHTLYMIMIIVYNVWNI